MFDHHTNSSTDAHLVEQWLRAVDDEALDRAMQSLYDDMARAIAERDPRCVASGRCCHFEQYGHRLYVTGLEAAWCVKQLASPVSVQAVAEARERGDCPFLHDERCSVHTIKPMGCRAFFCDPTADDWQKELYEHALERLRAMHDAFHVPYRYMEWRALLAMFAVEGAPADPIAQSPRSFVQVRIR